MESEIIETVLKEISEDLKYSNNINTENKSKLFAIESKINSNAITKPLIDTKPIEQIISKGMDNIATIVDQTKDKRCPAIEFRFFPEHNRVEYYKIVYGRILFWVVMLFIAKYLYLLGSQWINKSYDEQKYKKAWENLYQNQGKANQKIMQKIIGNN